MKSNDKGFSLLDVLVGMVIIALLVTAITAAVYSAATQVNLAGAALTAQTSSQSAQWSTANSSSSAPTQSVTIDTQSGTTSESVPYYGGNWYAP
jgi:prepilin-type N-terminal cleavage/methylation domain-containing protein